MTSIRGPGNRTRGRPGSPSRSARVQVSRLPTQLDQFALLSTGQAFTVATVDLVLRHPTPQTRLADTEIAGCRHDRLTLRDKVQCSTPDLRRLWCGHSWNSLPRRSSPQIRCPRKRVRLPLQLHQLRIRQRAQLPPLEHPQLRDHASHHIGHPGNHRPKRKIHTNSQHTGSDNQDKTGAVHRAIDRLAGRTRGATETILPIAAPEERRPRTRLHCWA